MNCNNPDGSPLEFLTVKELSEHVKSGHKIMPQLKENPSPNPVQSSSPPKPELKPIQLGYKYSGNCKDCGREVETIILDINKKEQKAVAYCIHCRKECTQESVVPISQFKEKK